MGSMNVPRHPTPIPDGWTQADCEAWEERAAILELDGGMDREAAERVAVDETGERRMRNGNGD